MLKPIACTYVQSIIQQVARFNYYFGRLLFQIYHLGLGKNISKSSLSRANQNRDYHIFEEFAYFLVNEARQKRVTDIFKLGGNVVLNPSNRNPIRCQSK